MLAEPEKNWFGELKEGDAVLRVQCLKPVKPGSTSFYMESDGERGYQDVIAIFAEDVWYSNLVLDEDYIVEIFEGEEPYVSISLLKPIPTFCASWC